MFKGVLPKSVRIKERSMTKTPCPSRKLSATPRTYLRIPFRGMFISTCSLQEYKFARSPWDLGGSVGVQGPKRSQRRKRGAAVDLHRPRGQGQGLRPERVVVEVRARDHAGSDLSHWLCKAGRTAAKENRPYTQ